MNAPTTTPPVSPVPPSVPVPPTVAVPTPPAPPPPPSAPGLDILSKVFGLSVVITAPSYVVGYIYTSAYYRNLGASWYVSSVSTNCILESGVLATLGMVVGLLWGFAEEPSPRARKLMQAGQYVLAVASAIFAARAEELATSPQLTYLCAWAPAFLSAVFFGLLAAIQCERIWASGFKADRKIAVEILSSGAALLITFAFLGTFNADADKDPKTTGLPKVLAKEVLAKEALAKGKAPADDGLTRFVHCEGELALLMHVPPPGKKPTFSLAKLDPLDQLLPP